MGVALGACALKPHFAIVPGLVLLAAGSWRAVAGMFAMGFAQVAVTALALGSHVYVEYLQTSLTVLRDPTLYEPKLWQAHGLKNALDLLLGRGPLATVTYIVLAAALVWMAARVWRRGVSGRLGFAVLVATSTLLNPHLYGYDLVVLAPALIISADWIVLHPRDPRSVTMQWLLTGIFLVPLVAPLAAFTRVQLSVPLLAWFCWQLATEADRVPPTADL